MNSIARPRKRPRDRSVNFRSCAWLLLHEAAWNVYMTPVATTEEGVRLRHWLARRRTTLVRADLERVARLWPARMIRP